MPDISPTGVSSSDPTPSALVEVVLGAGQAGGFGGTRAMMILANASAAGSAVRDSVIYGPDTPTPMPDEAAVIALFGSGSPGHRMWLKAARLLQPANIPIYMVAVTSSSGAAASKQVTLLNVPSSAGTLRVFVGETFVDVQFLAGDSLSSITAAVAAAVNARTKWAVTCAPSTNVSANDSFTLSAKVPGPRGNFIRVMVQISFGNGGTPNTTLNGAGAVADTTLTGGTTADSNATALGTIAANRYYWTVSEAEDATQIGALSTSIGTQALPGNGNRQRGFYGSVDTQSNVDTLVAAINNARLECIWSQGNPWTPAELAVHAAAIYAVSESQAILRCTFSNFPANDAESALWGNVPAPRSPSNWPSKINITIALNSGVSPLRVLLNGTTQLVKRITNRCLNGSNPDYRVRDAHRVTVADFFADDLGAIETSLMAGKNLVDDPPPGVPLPPNSISPRTVRNVVNDLLNQYGPSGSGLLKNIEQSKAALVVARQTASPNRLGVSVPIYVTDIADQIWNVVSQVA